MTSNHLDGIIAKQHGSTAAFVVFVDVVKYSLRKSVMQQRIIQEFSKALSGALESVSAKYIAASQKQNLNLSTDMIRIPTGDGAAIVFPFEGMQNIHLDFAIDFLTHSLSNRGGDTCEIFDGQGWCNCHNFYDVRIGIADGKVIVFKDVNDNYNVAGGIINTAARVMGLADKQQIIFTQEAYNNVIDMTEDIELESRFVSHGSIQVKHGIRLDVYQYVGGRDNFINCGIPIQIEISTKLDSIRSSNSTLGKATNSRSLSEQLANLEIVEILKEMPLPAGLESMFSNSSGGMPDKASARAFVEAFKIVDGLMKGKLPQFIDSALPTDDKKS